MYLGIFYVIQLLMSNNNTNKFVLATGSHLVPSVNFIFGVRPLFAAPRLSSKNMSNFMFKFLISQLTDFFIFSLSFQAKFNLQSTTFDDKLLHEKGRKDFLKKIKKLANVNFFKFKFPAKMINPNSRRSTLANAGCFLEDLEPKGRSESATTTNTKRYVPRVVVLPMVITSFQVIGQSCDA